MKGSDGVHLHLPMVWAFGAQERGSSMAYSMLAKVGQNSGYFFRFSVSLISNQYYGWTEEWLTYKIHQKSVARNTSLRIGEGGVVFFSILGLITLQSGILLNLGRRKKINCCRISAMNSKHQQNGMVRSHVSWQTSQHRRLRRLREIRPIPAWSVNCVCHAAPKCIFKHKNRPRIKDWPEKCSATAPGAAIKCTYL